MRLFLTMLVVVYLFSACGNHNAEEDTSQFNNGATVLLSGTSQKSRIKINEPVQLIATTKNGEKEPSYFAVSSRQEIANVAANNQIITIIGVQVGKTKIIVIDDANGLAIAEFDTEVYDPDITNDDNDDDDGIPNEDDDDDDIVTENEIGPIGPEVVINIQDEVMNFKSIPRGRFIMGDHSPAGKADSLPKHSVILTQSFWMSEFEVTNEQYLAFLNDSETDVRLKDGIIKGDYNRDGVDEVWLKIKPAGNGYIESNLTILEENANKPVIEVSWYGAMAYCRWLSAKQIGTFRLPTEAEWEYAVRGNQKNEVGEIIYFRYPWGLDLYDSVYANLFGKSGIDTYATVAPINQFVLGKTLLGLEDTIGNVSEWTYDTFAKYTSTEATDPSGPESDGSKVYRGGSWSDPASQTSVSNRNALTAESTSPTLGFRIARFDNKKDPIHIHESVSPN